MARANAFSLSWSPAVSNRSRSSASVGGLRIAGTKYRGVRYRYLTANPNCAGVDFTSAGDTEQYPAKAFAFYFSLSAYMWERGDETNQVVQLDQNCGWLDIGGPVWLDVDVMNSSGQIVRGGLVSEVTLAWSVSFDPTWDPDIGKYKLPFSKSYSASRKVLGLVPCSTPPSGALQISGFPSATAYSGDRINTDTSDISGIPQSWNFSQTKLLQSGSFLACYNVNPKYIDSTPSPAWTSGGSVGGTPLTIGLYAVNLSATNVRIGSYLSEFTTIQPVCVLAPSLYLSATYSI